MTAPLKNVVCVATLKDIRTWIHASHAIPQHIPAERYVLVTPDKYVSVFKAVSNPRFEVVSENQVTRDFDLAYVAARKPTEGRAGWYYQQLLKIQTLIYLPSNHDDVLLIWDADTIPLADLVYIRDDKLIYFTSTENHQPCFEAIRSLTGMERKVDFSFIAQCFPIYREWLDDFIAFVERRHGVRWYDAILNATDLSESSGFSEYETLGTFLTNTRPDCLLTQEAAWERFGNRICPVERAREEILGTKFAYVSYETWDDAQMPAISKELPRPKDAADFLDLFFNTITGRRAVVQIGATDGVMEDPLHHHLCDHRHDDVVGVLIEPLEYYFEKLTKLHKDRPNTITFKVAAGSSEATRKFYYIAPEIASEMNGDGPPNNWAQGQGSFYRESVEYRIDENKFRGENYRANISKYLAAIRETEVKVIPLRYISLGGIDDCLMIVDAQGTELDVLLGVNWRQRPNWLILEQDRGEVRMIDDLLTALGYVRICGTYNVVWGLAEAPITFSG